MVASQIRANARESLTGKWGKAALMILVYGIIVCVINYLAFLIPVVGPILITVISMPISYGLIVSFMKLKRGEEVGNVGFLSSGFSAFGKVWGVFGNTVLKMILPICLLIIFIILMVVSTRGAISSTVKYLYTPSTGVGFTAGFGVLGFISFIGYFASLIYVIVKGYLYSLSYYILADNPNMSGKEIVEESERLMKGHRWSYVWLGFTFIGWAFLAAFTFGIGMFWLMPYMMVAAICFYEELAERTNAPVVENVVNTEE